MCAPKQSLPDADCTRGAGNSSTRVRASSPPGGRTLADKSAKQSCEMGLVGEAALDRDLPRCLFGRQHEALRPLHSAADDVLVGGVPDTFAECNVEVEFAETSNPGEILVTDRGVQVRVDVSQNAP